ncbi:hypothetical protein L202_04871 [Cryptococcus amylolentus CBS 6039]|uniref:Uncharacterized protein n=2 Tax=Cryptococcus amylolentus TaxID=104669 RepID=A0A1E3HN07_9TREE|nr:hypothetical protein L202_04871 [Cryptococcus amylolentus CBS 6039]ODN77730.1 hypothetical protein L202_04871 [Cryptococcus amylolentus CBS 6039]ODO05737.1 hypothetical protein I350_04798 [Cryptococcus amylolentus CBS 6273]
MPPPPIPTSSRPTSYNPFRSSNTTIPPVAPATPPPPSYGTHTAHPTQPPQHTSYDAYEPVQYSSLSDLQKNKPPKNTSTQTSGWGGRGSSHGRGDSSAGASSSGGRRVPPIPQEGMMPAVPSAPPRRDVSTTAATAPPPVPPRNSSGLQSYIPESAKSGFNTASERVVDGWNSVATVQRKDQVLSGVGKLGAGAFKLAGKGVYQVGKFAAK